MSSFHGNGAPPPSGTPVSTPTPLSSQPALLSGRRDFYKIVEQMGSIIEEAQIIENQIENSAPPPSSAHFIEAVASYENLAGNFQNCRERIDLMKRMDVLRGLDIKGELESFGIHVDAQLENFFRFSESLKNSGNPKTSENLVEAVKKLQKDVEDVKIQMNRHHEETREDIRRIMGILENLATGNAENPRNGFRRRESPPTREYGRYGTTRGNGQQMTASTLAAHISDETSRFGENSGNGGPPNQGSWGTQDSSRRRPDFLTNDIEPTPPTVAVPVQNVRIVPKIEGRIRYRSLVVHVDPNLYGKKRRNYGLAWSSVGNFHFRDKPSHRNGKYVKPGDWVVLDVRDHVSKRGRRFQEVRIIDEISGSGEPRVEWGDDPRNPKLITTIYISPRSPIEMENYFCQHTYCKWIRVNAEIVKGKGEKSIDVKIQRLSVAVEVPERNDVCYWEVVELLDLNVV